MNVVLHGDRLGDRAVGKPKTLTVVNAKDPATAVKLAKQLLQSGTWRTAPKTGDDVDKAVYVLRVHTPAALAVLPRVAIAAMTKDPPSPGCHWCSVHTEVLRSNGEEPYPPRDEFTLAFLGNPCAKCSARHARSDEMVASLKLYHELVAEGIPPGVAGVSRTRVDAYRRMAEIRALEQAQPPKAPAPTRALQASGRRPRVPDSKYYRPRPVPWPAEARRAR